MSPDFKIAKELATIYSTAAEWQRVTQIILGMLPNNEFKSLFKKMADTLPGLFPVVTESVAPLLHIQEFADFERDFDSIQASYQQSFLSQASKPRHYAEATHELYLELVQFKEVKTSYPILKRSYSDLYDYMDKWVTNDAWLVMSCDVVFKSTNRLLLDFANQKKQDSEEAFLLFSGFVSPISTLLTALDALYPAILTTSTSALETA
ncbi:hypothetical protein [Teredinibacter turnerae]|uniref:hypothetical protein n=1 Tax=Teredinibacter turnerae TaxID=2426 RepID=UPI00035F3E34|nr:hypothetical protein [Teredinibacter turnerae]